MNLKQYINYKKFLPFSVVLVELLFWFNLALFLEYRFVYNRTLRNRHYLKNWRHRKTSMHNVSCFIIIIFYFKYTFLVKRWLCCNWISFKVFLCKEKNPALWFLWLMWRKLVIYTFLSERKWLMIMVGLFNGNEKLHA